MTFEEIISDKRGSRVERGGAGLHRRGEHGRGHETFKTDRQKVRDEECVSIGGALRRSAGESVLLHEGNANHPWKHKEENRPDFQEGAKQRAKASVTFVLRGQH